LTLALTALSHGTAPIIISLVSAVFFMAAEYIFLAYDSPKAFDSLKDFLYAPAKRAPTTASLSESASIERTVSVSTQDQNRWLEESDQDMWEHMLKHGKIESIFA
jgi:hypothetical protein